MRFVFEIPDQLVPVTSDTATPGSASDAISGGAAPAPIAVAGLSVDASSAGEAEHPSGGVAIANGSGSAIDGGASHAG
jgi:hypothetical protein